MIKQFITKFIPKENKNPYIKEAYTRVHCGVFMTARQKKTSYKEVSTDSEWKKVTKTNDIQKYSSAT